MGGHAGSILLLSPPSFDIPPTGCGIAMVAMTGFGVFRVHQKKWDFMQMLLDTGWGSIIGM